MQIVTSGQFFVCFKVLRPSQHYSPGQTPPKFKLFVGVFVFGFAICINGFVFLSLRTHFRS